MHIVHLTSVHPWDDTRIFHKMCRSCAMAGHDTHLVAPHPDTDQAWQKDGVTVHPVHPGKNRLERMAKTAARVFAEGARLGGDIYHFHDPEGLGHAVRWQRRLGKPFVYDAHEDYRLAILDKPWLPKHLRQAVASWFGHKEDALSQRLAGVVTATPSIAERFRACRHVACIANSPIAGELFQPGDNSSAVNPVYIGAISSSRGIKEMVSAIALAKNVFSLVLAGKFCPACLLEEVRTEPGWDKVDYKGWLSRKEIADAPAGCGIGLLLLQPTPAFLSSLPIKLFEYMSASLPIIASDFPLWREIIEQEHCGLLVNPQDPAAIAKAIDYLSEHRQEAWEMGANGRKAVLSKYNWDTQFKKLLEFYSAIVDCNQVG